MTEPNPEETIQPEVAPEPTDTEQPSEQPSEVVVEPTPETEQHVADESLAPEPVETPAEETAEEPAPSALTPEPEAGVQVGDEKDDSAKLTPTEATTADGEETLQAPVSPPGLITSSAGEIAAQAADITAEDTPYQDAVKAGVDPQSATHLAAVPTVATTTGGDGITRIINTNADAGWKPAPVESDPKVREELEKKSKLLEDRLDGSALLER